MYHLTVIEIQSILNTDNLLREIVQNKEWHHKIHQKDLLKQKLTNLSYDSKNSNESTLFFCKGLAFKEEYLNEATINGARFYVSEKVYEASSAVGFIVHDVRKAMAILAREFYKNPQNDLSITGITGTKGKTTTAYFLESILQKSTDQKTALFSSISNSMDAVHYSKAKLTTPESLDLFEMMAKSVENGMTHLIMEVSSQAYKLDRVYGLDFDIAVFLNISTDHIGPLEHPSFEDYFFCKRQLLTHAKQSVLYRGSMHFDLIKEEAEEAGKVFVYGEKQKDSHYYIDTSKTSSSFTIASTQTDSLSICGEYTLSLPGDFNKENALSAIIVAALLGANKEQCQSGIRQTRVPGRMEMFTQKNKSSVYVDYAHNYISLKRLLEFVKQEHPEGKIITVLGSPGDKGISRRKDFGEVLSALSDISILTADDPNFDDPVDIAKEIESHMAPKKHTEIISDRKAAIEKALQMAKPEDAIVIAGKGDVKYQIVNGKWSPFPGDDEVVKQYIEHEGSSNKIL